MTAVTCNDVILTLFHSTVRLEREVYERLVRSLYDYYDTQERTPQQYKFGNPQGSSCTFAPGQTRITEYFGEDPPEVVLERIQRVIDAFSGVLGLTRYKAYDVQISALVRQKDIGNQGKINYLTSEEYITNTFLQDLDYGPLGGTSTGVGLRFLFRREDNSYDLRIEPYFKDRQFLFLDLAVQYNQPISDVSTVGRLLQNELDYIRDRVLAFVRHEKLPG